MVGDARFDRGFALSLAGFLGDEGDCEGGLHALVDRVESEVEDEVLLRSAYPLVCLCGLVFLDRLTGWERRGWGW